MFVFARLYAFHRRCGWSRRHAFRKALATVLRDIQLNRGVTKQ